MTSKTYFAVTADGRRRFETLRRDDAVKFAQVINRAEQRGEPGRPFAEIHELPVKQVNT